MIQNKQFNINRYTMNDNIERLMVLLEELVDFPSNFKHPNLDWDTGFFKVVYMVKSYARLRNNPTITDISKFLLTVEALIDNDMDKVNSLSDEVGLFRVLGGYAAIRSINTLLEQQFGV